MRPEFPSRPYSYCTAIVEPAIANKLRLPCIIVTALHFPRPAVVLHGFKSDIVTVRRRVPTDATALTARQYRRNKSVGKPESVICIHTPDRFWHLGARG